MKIFEIHIRLLVIQILKVYIYIFLKIKIKIIFSQFSIADKFIFFDFYKYRKYFYLNMDIVVLQKF